MKMSGVRPARERKLVDYSKFADHGDDDFEDDDFSSFTPPVVAKKKKKESKKVEKKFVKKVDNDVKTLSDAAAIKRKSLNRKTPEERMFEKEMELALEMSRTDSQVNDQVTAKLNREPVETMNIEEGHKQSTVVVIEPVPRDLKRVGVIEEKANSDTALEKKTNKSERSFSTAAYDSSDIAVLESDVAVINSKRKAAKKRVYVDSDDESEVEHDEDYAPNGSFSDEKESDSEFDPSDNDSDFEDAKKKNVKNATKKGVKKKTTSEKSATREVTKKANAANSSKKICLNNISSNEALTVTTSDSTFRSPLKGIQNKSKSPEAKPKTSGIDTSKTNVNDSLIKSPASINVVKSPRTSLSAGKFSITSAAAGKFNSPAPTSGLSKITKSPNCGGASNSLLTSPASGGLRLGLSRNNRKLKPLHSNVKVT